MMPYSWMDIAHSIVQERHDAMIRGAERARLAAEMPRDDVGRVAALRRQLGAAMVRAGQRLQGAQRPEAAADLPYLTIVR